MNRIYDLLYDYQKEAVDKSFDHRKYGLFLPPGLGKTYTSLSIVQEKQMKKIVVFCPPSIVLQWERECVKFFNAPIFTLEGKKSKKKKLEALDEAMNYNERFIIIPYSLISRKDWGERLIELGVFDRETFVIFDEVHMVNNISSISGKFAVKLMKTAGIRATFLTGTLITKDYINTLNIMRLFGIDMTKKMFLARYCFTRKMSTGRYPIELIVGYQKKQTKEIDRFFHKRSTFLTEDDIDSVQLPESVEIDYPFAYENRAIYDYVVKKHVYKDEVIEHIAERFLRARTMASGWFKQDRIDQSKSNALLELLKGSDEDFVIMFQFNCERADILEVCKKLDIEVFEYNGTRKDFHDANPLLACKKRKVVLGHYLSISTGVDYLKNIFHRMIFYSIPPNGGTLLQAKRRINRVGVGKSAYYYYFRAEKTIEDKCWATVKRGEELNDSMYQQYEEQFIKV